MSDPSFLVPFRGFPPEPPAPRQRGSRSLFTLAAVLVLVLFVAGLVLAASGPGGRTANGRAPGAGAPAAGAPAAGAPAPGTLRVFGSDPQTWDPALQGDAATAATLAQVYEGLTAFDVNSHPQPALASSWQVQDEGRRIAFQLRANLRFSDGSPLGPQDVVRSWLRLLDPARPSPLASLLSDVTGADAYLRGGPREGVDIRAQGDRVVVGFRRPAAYFIAVTASPSLAVVPAQLPQGIEGGKLPQGFVGSGGYVATAQSHTAISLAANPNYWAGPPAISNVELVTDLGGKSPVDAFNDGELDYTAISSSDAAWIRYDRELGAQLRSDESFSVEYYGFDATKPPFNDARVRRAFAQAVDWDRLVRLADPTGTPATSLVPVGVPGRGEQDYSPAFDPAGARALLASAGYPGGKGFPAVTLVTSGFAYDVGIARGLKDALGVDVRVENLPFDEYFGRLAADPPAFWALSWIADYAAPQDFLGLLLETGSTNNYGHWSNPSYDAELDAAAATGDVAQQERHYARAQEILVHETPVIPVTYGDSWALSRAGLLGAGAAGVGFVRFAGLAWAGR